MKTYIASIAIVAIVLLAGWYAWKEGEQKDFDAAISGAETLIASATYQCDNGKSIVASYYEGPAMAPAANGMPVPTGKVEVSLGGRATTSLNQTISGSGVRYASADESFVFWNKGDEALIMRDNSMDPEYKNCHASTTTVPVSPENQ